MVFNFSVRWRVRKIDSRWAPISNRKICLFVKVSPKCVCMGTFSPTIESSSIIHGTYITSLSVCPSDTLSVMLLLVSWYLVEVLLYFGYILVWVIDDWQLPAMSSVSLTVKTIELKKKKKKPLILYMYFGHFLEILSNTNALT